MINHAPPRGRIGLPINLSHPYQAELKLPINLAPPTGRTF
ncbi:ORF64 [Duck adenovirus 3]|nr:ORF64 [Duck adenovirus 3]